MHKLQTLKCVGRLIKPDLKRHCGSLATQTLFSRSYFCKTPSYHYSIENKNSSKENHIADKTPESELRPDKQPEIRRFEQADKKVGYLIGKLFSFRLIGNLLHGIFSRALQGD